MASADDTRQPAPGRPDLRTLRVGDLVSRVRSGEIRIPAFQRGIKWDVHDALKLLDSIERGYPIGALLLWQRPADAERLIHGSLTIDAPALSDALWVVDGQQRILSLARVFAGAGHPDEPFAAFYDLKAHRFRHHGRRESPNPHDLPLTEVLDAARLADWLLARRELGLDGAAANQLGERLRDYEIPAHVVLTDDEQAVREIFSRVNNTGKRMEDHEVFHGRYGARGPDPADLKAVAASLADLGFGPLPEPDLHSMLLATRSTDLTRDRAPELSGAQAQQAFGDLARSARAALIFLRNAGFPHVSLLPYQPPLLVLTRFFHRHPRPHARSLELLARWLWRGAVTGAHSFDGGKLRRALLTTDLDEHAAVLSLLAELPAGPEAPPDLDDYSFRYARSKLALLALLALRPLSLQDGELIVPEAPGEQGAYHQLVRTILPEHPGGLANRMLHPASPGGLARAIVACDDPGVLASHAISAEARRALKFDRPGDFLAMRRADLLALVQDFLDRRAAWDERDTPPLESLHISTGTDLV